MKKTALVLSVLMGTAVIPEAASASIEQPPGKQKAMDKQFESVAKQTYKYFEDFTDEETGLTSDIVRLDEGEEGKHTSPTNIGLYMLSVISAEEMGFITKEEAMAEIQKTLDSLEDMETWNGLYYNWYYTEDASLMTDWGQFISQVDNGWLTAALYVVSEAYDELSEQSWDLAEEMDYSTLYDEEENLFYGGFDVEDGAYTEHHYGALYTEPRMTSYLAIGKGDVPSEHWWHMDRTLPAEWDWQSQTPEGYEVEYDGVSFFQGHYDYEGIKFVPSWGGSMFEGLMPGLLMKEKELGTQGLGLNNARHVEVQQAYADDQDYPAWGFSPAAVPGDYQEFGVPAAGIEGYPETGIVTPHASFLALDYDPKAVYENMKSLRSLGAYGPYGFFDTVDMNSGQVTKAYLALDQGMIMLSIANHLHDGLIKEYFHDTKIGSAPEHLLEREEFSIQE
jgi:hypothetical protein